jgi:hypothetical protein
LRFFLPVSRYLSGIISWSAFAFRIAETYASLPACQPTGLPQTLSAQSISIEKANSFCAAECVLHSAFIPHNIRPITTFKPLTLPQLPLASVIESLFQSTNAWDVSRVVRAVKLLPCSLNALDLPASLPKDSQHRN